MKASNTLSDSIATPAIPILTDTNPADAQRNTTLVKPLQSSLIVDADGEWTSHCYDQVSVTTVGAELDALLNEGWSLWGIFMEGMNYLSRISGNYILVGRERLAYSREPRGAQGELLRLERLRATGVTDADIFWAGLEKLAGPPPPGDDESLRRLRTVDELDDG
jgi:hypothetical protein